MSKNSTTTLGNMAIVTETVGQYKEIADKLNLDAATRRELDEAILQIYRTAYALGRSERPPSFTEPKQEKR